MSARSIGPTFQPAGSLAARPAGWQRDTAARATAGSSAVARLRQAALDARTMGRAAVRDLPVELVEDVLREVRQLEQRVRTARITAPPESRP